MNLINNKKIAITCLSFIVMYLLWALWQEVPLSATLYNVSVFILFIWSALLFLKNVSNRNVSKLEFIECIMLIAWCLCMFVVYQFVYTMKEVSFFGITVDSHARLMIYSVLTLIPGIYILGKCKLKNRHLFKVLFFLIITTSLFFAIQAIIVFPDALRARSTAESLGYEDVLFGTPTYSIVYAMVLLEPWVVSRINNTNKIKKVFYTYIAISIAIIITVSQFATALITLLIVMLYYFIERKEKYRRLLEVFITSVIVLIYGSTEVIGKGLIVLASIVKGAWTEKLTEIGCFFMSGSATGDLATRTDLYQISWNTFIKSPIFGMLWGYKGEIGGHSTIFDMLALVGVFGTLFFIMAIYFSYKRMRYKLNSKSEMAAIRATMVGYVILLIAKNTISALAISYTYFVLIPILFFMEDT